MIQEIITFAIVCIFATMAITTIAVAFMILQGKEIEVKIPYYWFEKEKDNE